MDEASEGVGMLISLRKSAFAAVGALLLGLLAPTALADGLVKLKLRLDPHIMEGRIIEVHRIKENGQTEMVVDRDGTTDLQSRADQFGTLGKNPTAEDPKGGRVTQSKEEAEKGHYTLNLEPGKYFIRVKYLDHTKARESQTFDVEEYDKSRDNRTVVTVTWEGVEVKKKEKPRSVTSGSGTGSDAFALDYYAGLAYGYGSLGTSVNTSFPGGGNGESIALHSLAIEAGAWAPIGNTGFLVGAGVGVDLLGSFAGLDTDEHPPQGEDDTRISVNQYAYFDLYVGAELGEVGSYGELYGLFGLRGTLLDMEGVTNEEGGGGEKERFSETKFLVGPMAAVELELGPIGGLGNLGNLGNLGEQAPRARIGIGLDYLPGSEVEGQSSTFPFDYKFKTDGAVRAQVYIHVAF
jgi:hypothetical protein